MRWHAIFLMPLAACAPSDGSEAPAERGLISLAGQIEEQSLDEASGIVASRRRNDVLWFINDDGKATVHATDLTGKDIGRLRIDDADNRDWEDLAAFTLDDTPYLVVAEIGDNDARYETYRLHVVGEPDLEPDSKRRKAADWTVEFQYPDGPRDSESLAVDAGEGRAYVLSKRDLPPRLYAVPLQPTEEGVQIATFLGPVRSLPPPSRHEIEIAALVKDWSWQPAAMDFSRDGRHAVVLTYESVYLYRREANQSWYQALSQEPLGLSIRPLRDAESVAFSADGRSLYVTTEGKNPPLIRIDIADALEMTIP